MKTGYQETGYIIIVLILDVILVIGFSIHLREVLGCPILVMLGPLTQPDANGYR